MCIVVAGQAKQINRGQSFPKELQYEWAGTNEYNTGKLVRK